MENEIKDPLARWVKDLLVSSDCKLTQYHLDNGFDFKTEKWTNETSFKACVAFVAYNIEFERPGRGSGIGLGFIADEINEIYPDTL